MKILDPHKIISLSKNTTGNKRKMARNYNEILNWFLDYQNNYEEYIRAESAYYSSSVLLADYNWMKNINKTTYDKPITAGMLLAVDFGKCYKEECSFIHTALCLLVTGKKVLVVPATTKDTRIKKAYHPIEDPKANHSMWLGRVEDGFSERCALLLNDARFISLGRIVNDYSIIKVNIIGDIRSEVLSIMFPNQVKSFKNKIYELEKENIALKKRLNTFDTNSK